MMTSPRDDKGRVWESRIRLFLWDLRKTKKPPHGLRELEVWVPTPLVMQGKRLVSVIKSLPVP